MTSFLGLWLGPMPSGSVTTEEYKLCGPRQSHPGVFNFQISHTGVSSPIHLSPLLD